MTKLASILINTVTASSLFAAPGAKKTEIPIELQAVIEAARHAVEPDGAGYKASNSEQNLELRFEQATTTVIAPDGQLQLRFAGCGRGTQLVRQERATLAVSKNRVEYRRGPITEWYVNDTHGLEQGFTLVERPTGEGPLVVALQVEGGLTPRLEGPGAVMLERRGTAVLRYGGLKAWDTLGRELAARLEVSDQEVRLIVADLEAMYPMTIDPWIQQAKLIASDALVGDSFGVTVALSGATALVGASGKSGGTGAAYVYGRSGTVWTEQAKLTASDGVAGDQFGISVALDGDTALVGASYKALDTGAAYIFVRSGTVWTQQAVLTASDGVAYDSFGSSVALSGNTTLVGAGNANSTGAVYVYVRSGAVWTEQAKLTMSDGVEGDAFGTVALDGDTAIVGALGKTNYTGAAYVYVRSGTAWTQQVKLTASDGVARDYFGNSVALSGDTALVGAYLKANYTGAAYVYVRSGSVWTEQAKLTASDGATQDLFGSSVALSGDTALIGAYGKANDAGAAYVYGRSGTVWTEQAKLIASDGVAGDTFGSSVALSGDTALMGAYGKASQTGAAYVYQNVATTANLTLNSNISSPFTTLTLTGSGFSPNETVGFRYVSSIGIPLGSVAADGIGAFTTTVRFPAEPYGSGLIRAVGQGSGLYGAANFAVTPRLFMSPGVAPVGTTVLAEGYGFGAGEQVDVYWYSSPRQLLGKVTADRTGSFFQATGLTFTIPAGAATGTNLVLGKGQTTQAVGKGYVTVQ
jgi:hypothetical protein